jgi:hypothetical protein
MKKLILFFILIVSTSWASAARTVLPPGHEFEIGDESFVCGESPSSRNECRIVNERGYFLIYQGKDMILFGHDFDHVVGRLKQLKEVGACP